MKKILSLILILTLALSTAFSLVACSNDNGGENNDNGAENNGNENTGYTVTAVTEDGIPVRGVKVSVKTASGMQLPFTTDSEGKATFSMDGVTSVTVTEVPSGYNYSKVGVEQSFDADGGFKVTLSEIPPYVVYVVDEDGNPVSGVTIKVCDDSNLCLKPATTGADGKASFNYVEGSFHAMINGADALPDGYTVDDLDETYDFVDNETTIVLVKVAD